MSNSSMSSSGPSGGGSGGAGTTPPQQQQQRPASVSSRMRSMWAHAVSFLLPASFASESSPVAHRGLLGQQQQQGWTGGGSAAGGGSSSTPPASGLRGTYVAAAAAAATAAPGSSAVAQTTSQPTTVATAAAGTMNGAAAGSGAYAAPLPNTVLSPSSALDLMRAYHLYVQSQKTRWRSVVVLLFALLFFSYCTFRQTHDAGFDDGGSSGVGGGGGGIAAGGTSGVAGAGPTAKDASIRAGLSSMEADGSGAGGGGSGEEFIGSSDAAPRRFQPPWLMRVLLGSTATPEQMDVGNVEWWPPSNRTPDTTDPSGVRGLNVGTPDAASLSVARSLPPWSADTRRGVVAAMSRLAGRMTRVFVTPEPPPYEQAMTAFFRTRQAMTGGSCNRCQAHAIEQDVRSERLQYRQFLRENKLRVPTLLYYNRLPVYAMLHHFRLMRVRNYQLLDYVSRPDAGLRRPETVGNDVSHDAALHARELDFELTRLSFVFYLQRLHLRALRHADAMRLETFHFLRHLSSTVPILRQLWTGQDHCSWTGVSCVIVRVPLNLLIDDDHPAVQAFVEDIFALCRGRDCTQRRCVPPACGAYTQFLTRRLFTSAAPAYWMRWDRLDDTAAMDEMVFPKAVPRKAVGIDAAVAAQQQQAAAAAAAANGEGGTRRPSPFGTTRQKTNGVHTPRTEGESAVHGSPAAAVAARANRVTSSSARTVWTEQQFAYEHPSLLLADPLLLVDVDVESIVDEVVRPAAPAAMAARMAAGMPADPTSTYRDNVERPLIEDLLPMQRKLLRTNAAAAPRGIRYGKQSSDSGSPMVTVPLTFVMLHLPGMGLRGYLPDFYDSQSSYDVVDGGAAGGRAGGGSTGASGKAGSEGDNEERASAGGAAAAAGQRASGASAWQRRAAQDVRVQDPRSDVYWGRLSRQRMLERRNLTSARLRRSVGSVQSIASELQRVLRRVEKIGTRSHHEDLAAYFSEVSTLAQFQNERWSPYRWPEAMITVTNAVAQSAAGRLYPILEDNAFSTAFTAPVYNVDHHVEVFGEINPRLVALLAIDVSSNPLLTHLFPRTWMSITYLQSVHTAGASILAPPLRLRGRSYNETHYCPDGTGTEESDVYLDDARRSQQLVFADAQRDGAVVASVTATSDGGGTRVLQTSMHDRDFIGSTLVPPYPKIDGVFPEGGVEAFFHNTNPLSSQHYLYKDLQSTFDDGLWQGIRRLVGQQQQQQQQQQGQEQPPPPSQQ